MTSYQDLQLWQKAIDLVKQTYALTRTFPVSEQYALTVQVNRSVVSVPSNIAEGWARNSTKDFVRFLCIARGSLAEAETQLIIAKNLGYITGAQFQTI
ncbi:MAG: four helix bundle protein [Patescibacteria group bacterium]